MNKLERFAEMKTFSNVVQASYNEIFNKNHELKGKWNSGFFTNNNPLVLELGCGKGEYTVNLAQYYPEKNFIGMEIKGARIWKGAKMAIQANLKNVAFIRTRIDFIRSFFSENEVNEIWITFPDPQPKKAKKRLTSPCFLNLYKPLLDKENAIIHLKTDNRDLYEYTLDVIKINNLNLIRHTSDLYQSDCLDEITSIKTFYEQLFLKEGKLITYIEFTLNTDKQLIEPPEKETN